MKPINKPTTRPTYVFVKRAKPPTTRALRDVLDSSEAFASLRGGIEQSVALQQALTLFLPDYLHGNVDPGMIKDGFLTLFTPHAALAARLRHLEPALLASMQARGWPVRGCKIKVRPRGMPEPTPAKGANLSLVGAQCLRDLSEKMAPSPLQLALGRMANRHLGVPAGARPEAKETAGSAVSAGSKKPG
jgi:hypothetical protein